VSTPELLALEVVGSRWIQTQSTGPLNWLVAKQVSKISVGLDPQLEDPTAPTVGSSWLITHSASKAEPTTTVFQMHPLPWVGDSINRLSQIVLECVRDVCFISTMLLRRAGPNPHGPKLIIARTKSCMQMTAFSVGSDVNCSQVCLILNNRPTPLITPYFILVGSVQQNFLVF